MAKTPKGAGKSKKSQLKKQHYHAPMALQNDQNSSPPQQGWLAATGQSMLASLRALIPAVISPVNIVKGGIGATGSASVLEAIAKNSVPKILKNAVSSNQMTLKSGDLANWAALFANDFLSRILPISQENADYCQRKKEFLTTWLAEKLSLSLKTSATQAEKLLQQLENDAFPPGWSEQYYQVLEELGASQAFEETLEEMLAYSQPVVDAIQAPLSQAASIATTKIAQLAEKVAGYREAVVSTSCGLVAQVGTSYLTSTTIGMLVATPALPGAVVMVGTAMVANALTPFVADTIQKSIDIYTQNVVTRNIMEQSIDESVAKISARIETRKASFTDYKKLAVLKQMKQELIKNYGPDDQISPSRMEKIFNQQSRIKNREFILGIVENAKKIALDMQQAQATQPAKEMRQGKEAEREQFTQERAITFGRRS